MNIIHLLLQCFFIIILLKPGFSQGGDALNHIIPNEKFSVSGLKPRMNYKDIIDFLGKPDSINYSYTIVNKDTFKKLYYGKSYFETQSGVNTSFLIKDECFKLKYKNIKVGDNANKLKKLFPLSYQNKYYLYDNQKSVVKVGITHNDDSTGNYILFKIKNGKVVAFEFWYPNNLYNMCLP